MDILIGISAKIAECTVEPVGKWLCYPFYYSSNIESMKNQVVKLRFAQERVQHSIDAAIINNEGIEGDVKVWMCEANKTAKEASKVLECDEEAKTKGRARLNLKLRHRLSRKAKKLEKDIGEILINGKFDRVSYRPVVRIPYETSGSCHVNQGIVTTRHVDFVSFESRMSTATRIMETLRDDNIHVVGVWGMAGVGKSTLVREIGRQAKEENLFSEVAMANVTQSPDLRRIQGEIADMLDLKFDVESTVIGRAILLRQRLTGTEEKKKILVILDDIWQNLDLEAIGIPYEGCKVLLTSRNRDILVCKMGTQMNFGLEVLAEKDAWSLFEKMAGDCVEDPILRSTAIEVVKESAGLPLALVTLSKALRNKSLVDWKDALQLLRNPNPACLNRVQYHLYSSIELSCAHLKESNKEALNVLLLCAQMGCHILERDLFEHCYGLGLFHGINTMEDARNRLHTIVSILKDNCLLLQNPYSSQCLCMHKVVRDVATLIAQRDHIVFGGDLPLPISRRSDGDHNIYGGDHNMCGGDRPLQISYINAGDIEGMKSKLDGLESKLMETEVTISKLTEERRSSIEDIKVLQEKLAKLSRRGVRRVQNGFPLLFVCTVALISVVVVSIASLRRCPASSL